MSSEFLLSSRQLSVCGLRLFTQLTMAELFLKSDKAGMKAEAKLIKFNRIKMCLVTQHDYKTAFNKKNL